MPTRWMFSASASVALLTISFAAAQALQTVRVRGTIEMVHGQLLTVKSRNGSTATINLAEKAHVTAMVKASLSDIKVGDFIGITAMPQPDGSQKAIGIHIFMAAQRGVVPARFSSWDREPGSTMTNATVDANVTGIRSQTMMVKYSNGEKKIIVPLNTPIVRFVPGNMGDLKPGAQIFIFAGEKMPDGTIAARAIDVGRNGVAPPM